MTNDHIDPAAGETFARSLYTQYAKPLLTVVARLTGGDRQWAEDVVQETLIRGWRNAGQLLPQHQSRSLMPWLVTVARRVVIDDWQRRDARPREVFDDDLLALAAAPDDTEQVLRRMVVAELLGRLTTAHRRVVVEMFLHGRTVRDTASVLGCPTGTVKSRAFTAIRVMRGTEPQRRLVAVRGRPAGGVAKG